MAITLTETLNNLYVAATRNLKADVQDQIFKSRPLIDRLRRSGNIERITGGRKIERRVWKAERTTASWIARGGTTATTDTEFMTAVEWTMRTCAIPMVRYDDDEAVVAGKSKVVDLMREKFKHCTEQLTEELDDKVSAAQTGISMMGLPTLVATAPAVTPATLAGIDCTTEAWWRNHTTAATGMADLYLLSDMRKMFYDMTTEGKTPNLLIASQNVFEWYESQVDARHMIVDKATADAGFINLLYKGTPFVWSWKLDDNLYFLQTDHLYLCIDSKRDFALTDWKAIPQQVNDFVAQLYIRLQFITDNRRRQGVLHTITNTAGGY